MYTENLNRISSLAKEADELAMHANVESSKATDVVKRLQTEPFRVLVLGEFSRGKSTFINALVGEKVLPASVRPTTAVICAVKHGHDRKATVHYRDKNREKIHLDIPKEKASKALTLLTAKNKDAQSIEKVEVTLPIPGVNIPLEIIDTPGVNDIDTQREEITYTYLAQADAAIMLLDLQQPLSASENRFLLTKVIHNDISKILFVVNKVDQAREAERARAMAYVKERLHQVDVLDNPLILPVASKNALKAKGSGDASLLEASLFPAFETQLVQFLIEASGKGRLATALNRTKRVAKMVLKDIDDRLEGLSGEQAQLQQSIDKARQNQVALVNEQQAIKNDISVALNQFNNQGLTRIEGALAETRQRAQAIMSRSDFPAESAINALREQLNLAIRETVSIPTEMAAEIADRITEKYEASNVYLNVMANAFETDITVSVDPNQNSSSIMGGAIGAIVGAAALGLGPLGVIGLGALGAWLGNSTRQQPNIGMEIKTKTLSALNDLRDRTRDVLQRSSDALQRGLEERIIRPRVEAANQEVRKEQDLIDSMHLDGVAREQKVAKIKTLRDKTQDLIDRIETLGREL